MTAVRKPAFAADPHRRALLAKVHLAKKEMGLDDDTYRGVLLRVAQVDSAASCTERQLAAVVEDFKRLGWKPTTPAGRATRSRPATNPVAAKARALWISLHQLGAIDDPSERALEAFGRRQLKVERLAWADQSLGYRLIEALKAMAERAGWDQSTEGVKPHQKTIVLKRRLVEALLAKLKAAGVADAAWGVARSAREFGGIEGFTLLFAPESQLDIVTRTFAARLRDPAGHLR